MGNARLTPFRLGRPQARPDDNYPPLYLFVEPNVTSFVDGFYYYNDSCQDLGPLNPVVTTNPTHGTATFGTTSYTPPQGQPCAGYTFIGTEVFYTWTDTTSGETQDSFAMNWNDPESGVVEESTSYGLSIDADMPDKQVGADNTPGTCLCGDPISVGIGNVYEATTDYHTEGSNQLVFTRSYNSFGNPATLAVSLGLNWRSNYDRYLQITEAGGTATTVMAERADGRMVQFTLNGSTWVSDTDVDMTLVQSGSTWILTDQTDTVETYTQISSTAAIVNKIQMRGGYTQTLAYNPSNQLTSVKDMYGRELVLTYAGTLLQTVETPDKETLTYGFTPVTFNGTAGNVLASVSYPTSPVTSTGYQYGSGRLAASLTGITDEDGNLYSSWTYDGYGRALSSQHGGGADLTTITYNDSDGSRLVTNALGEPELYKFTILQGVPKVTEIDRQATTSTAAATETFTYDSNGYLASRSDWNGNLTVITNDSRGLPTKLVEASGTSQARTTLTGWSSAFHVPTSVQTQGLATSYSYDTSGNRVSRTDSDSAGTRSWSYGWTNALPTSITGPRTDVAQTTSFAYGSLGRLTAIKDALGRTTTISSSTPGNRPLVVVDPNGVKTQLAYDPRLRLITSSVVTKAGTLKTSFVYDAAGNLIEKIWPDKSFLANAYDPAHRLVQTIDALKNLMTYTLDPLGDRTRSVASNAGGTATWDDQAAFDALGRKIQDQRGAGQTTSVSYDNNGNAVTITDPLSEVTQKAYDALNRVSSVKDPAGGITSFAYDAHDRPLAVKAANGALTHYTYDGFGRVVQRVSPDTGTTKYTYDPADNLTTSLDAAGITTNRTYDALNRPSSTTYSGDSAENVFYAYDQGGHGFGVGRLTSLTDAAGAESFSYDERGNELTDSRASGSVALTTGYSYDRVSRVSGIAYPSGTAVDYARNAAGQVTTIRAQPPGASKALTVVAGLTYNPFGPLSTFKYGNGLAETRAYDGDYRLTGLTTGTVQELVYSYDHADNVLSLNDNANTPNNQSFGYDTLYHLTSASGAYGTVGWTYDQTGNRLTSTATGTSSTYSYASHSNVLTAITGSGASQFAYTAIGSIAGITPTTGSATTLAYNQAERLSAVALGGTQTASFTYDAFGRRFSKTSSKAQSLFQYDPAGHLLEETDGTGKARIDTIYLNGVPVADVTPSTGALYFLHTDRLGTPQIATTTQKAVAWRSAYLPFGANMGGSGLLTQNLRFPGQYADVETGWYQNGFRDYNPSLGRYMESDPIGLAGGPNTYSYVNDNPGRFTDLLGLLCEPGIQQSSNTLEQPTQFLPFLQTPPVFFDEPPELIEPPLDDFPSDPAQPPGPGYQWYGRPGSTPGGPDGNWYNPGTGETLRPDMGHEAPIDPHYDYRAPNGDWYRWYPNGNLVPKA